MTSVLAIRTKLFAQYPQFSTTDSAKLEQINGFIELAISEACALKKKVSSVRYEMGVVWLSAYYISIDPQNSSGKSASGLVTEEENADERIKYSDRETKSNSGNHSQNAYGQMYDNLLRSARITFRVV